MSHIFTHTEGQGAPVVVLHGWGMNQQVWQRIRAPLVCYARVTWVDLPGHGLSTAVPMESLEQTVAALKPLIPEGALLIGWSLGGIIAQALAHVLPSVKGLILVASTPRFVASETWTHGLPEAVLIGFAHDLQVNYAATVQRFFALQFMGARSEPHMIHSLRDAILSQPASIQALAAGLDILRTADQRHLVSTQTVPTLWLLGRLDKLIPVSLAQGLAELTGQDEQRVLTQEVVVLPKAAHVPFVTHPDEFLARVTAFIAKHNS